MLTEELTWLNTHPSKNEKHASSSTSDLMNSYQQKISLLHDEINRLKEDIDDRDKEVTQLRVQCKILKQRSRSVDRHNNGSSSEDNLQQQRTRRGISVESGGNLREQLEASSDEIRLLKNKLLRMEDELNNSVVVRMKIKENFIGEELVLLLFFRKKKVFWRDWMRKISIHNSMKISVYLPKKSVLFLLRRKPIHRLFSHPLERLHLAMKNHTIDPKISHDLHQVLRSSRWSKDFSVSLYRPGWKRLQMVLLTSVLTCVSPGDDDND